MAREGKRRQAKGMPGPEEVKEAADDYFSECDEAGRPYTLEGLCVALDVTMEALALIEARGGGECAEIVKKAKIRIQQDLVERGLAGNNRSTLTIFLLKNNHGYEEGYVVESEDGKLIRGLTKEQAAEILADE